jgi:hypothetical protein
MPPVPPRNTRRRTPSPHLRISTQFDNNRDNPAFQINLAQENDSAPRMFSTSQPALGNQRGSGGSTSGTNDLSYVTLFGVSHRHSQSLSDARSTPESNRRSGPLPPLRPEPSRPIPVPPQLTHQTSDTSIDQFSILRRPNTAMSHSKRTSSSGDTARFIPQSQQSEFDPYVASRIPRPSQLQPNRRTDEGRDLHPYDHNQRPSSTASLPRAPGDPVGQVQRGWSIDDDADNASLLLDRSPMEVDDGMSGSRGVYIATPRDVMTLGVMPHHHKTISSDTFATVMTESGPEESASNSHRFSSDPVEGESDGPPFSPTLSTLQSDARNNPGFASYAGRESLSGSSGWDASTVATHKTNPPLELPPLPTSGRNPRFSGRPLPIPSSNLNASHTLSPHPSPRLGHAQLGSEANSLHHNRSRSREEILNPGKNDPMRLFPASVRAAGYAIALTPDAVPSPARTPQPSEDGNFNSSANRPENGPNNSASSARAGGTGRGAPAGYVEREGGGGGTWGTDSSGIQSIFESVQQLPDLYPSHEAPSSGNKRTP